MIFKKLIVLALIFVGCDYFNSPEKLFSKAVMERNGKNPSKALEYLQQIMSSNKKSEIEIKSQFMIAEINYHDLKDFNKAIDEYENFFSDFSNHEKAPSSLFMQGYIYHNSLYDFDMAKNIYSQFLQKFPNHELANSVQWELDNLGLNIDEIPFLKHLTK